MPEQNIALPFIAPLFTIAGFLHLVSGPLRQSIEQARERTLFAILLLAIGLTIGTLNRKTLYPLLRICAYLAILTPIALLLIALYARWQDPYAP